MGRRVPESLQLPPATSTKPSTEIDEQKKPGFGPEEVDLGHGNPRLDTPGYRPSIRPGISLAWIARSSGAETKFDPGSGKGRGFDGDETYPRYDTEPLSSASLKM